MLCGIAKKKKKEREREKGVLSSLSIGENSHPSLRMPHLLGVRQDYGSAIPFSVWISNARR